MKRWTLFFAASLLVLMSCQRFPSDYEITSEQLVDITQFDKSADFKAFKTFAIVDSISVIKDNDSSRVRNAEAIALLDRIILNMQNRGYQLVNRTENPDLAINVSVVEITNVTVYAGWYWNYWGYYDPWYWGYPNGGYYYGYYPTYISSYSVGTIIIDLLDLKNYAQHDNKIYVIWNAYIRGLLDGTHTQQEILDNVDQCFAQTPVLSAH